VSEVGVMAMPSRPVTQLSDSELMAIAVGVERDSARVEAIEHRVIEGEATEIAPDNAEAEIDEAHGRA
jgi:hypothetical protein